jgi:hypothetical protein
MNVEIGTEAAQFLFWEYINGIFVAVQENLEREAVYRQETGKRMGEKSNNTTARMPDPLYIFQYSLGSCYPPPRPTFK